MRAIINYGTRMDVRPRYHANDASRDVLDIDPRAMDMADARGLSTSIDREGFALVEHRSAVTDFADAAQVWDLHREEICDLIKQQAGADLVLVNSPGVLRFGEKSKKSGAFNNSRPARFAHVDINDATADAFSERSRPEARTISRVAHFNVWRAITSPPQDVPLAICDARSVGPGDLVEADAVFDEPGRPEWSFVGLVATHNPAHRWHWFSDMSHDEALIFKTNDTDPSCAHCVPHVAFDNPLCPAETQPRGSIEMRAIAYWYG